MRQTPARVAAIDGLRGVLATIVVVDHALVACGHTVLGIAADISVAVFFVMSGYVLTRGWTGAFGAFLLRRFVRLWPVYAVSLAAGYGLARRAPELLEFFWIPLPRYDANEICPPAWSLFIEAWAALAMPAIVWSARGGTARSLTCIAGLVALDCAWIPQDRAVRALSCYLVCFLIGAGLSGHTVRSAALEHPAVQWLGRISYSFYLTHWLVFRAAFGLAGPAGVTAALPLALAVAAIVHRCIEAPSLRLSRLTAGAARAQRAATPISPEAVAPAAPGSMMARAHTPPHRRSARRPG